MTERKLQNLNGSPTLTGIWLTYRAKILATMSLLSIERLCAVAVPFVLGVPSTTSLREAIVASGCLLG